MRNARMRMLGHVMRLDRRAPAQMAMDLYFTDGKRPRGQPRTCLASGIRKDLSAADIGFRKPEDLARAREIAADRIRWRGLTRAPALNV